MQIAVCEIIIEKLKSHGIEYPRLAAKQLENLDRGKQMLLAEE